MSHYCLNLNFLMSVKLSFLCSSARVRTCIASQRIKSILHLNIFTFCYYSYIYLTKKSKWILAIPPRCAMLCKPLLFLLPDSPPLTESLPILQGPSSKAILSSTQEALMKRFFAAPHPLWSLYHRTLKAHCL